MATQYHVCWWLRIAHSCLLLLIFNRNALSIIHSQFAMHWNSTKHLAPTCLKIRDKIRVNTGEPTRGTFYADWLIHKLLQPYERGFILFVDVTCNNLKIKFDLIWFDTSTCFVINYYSVLYFLEQQLEIIQILINACVTILITILTIFSLFPLLQISLFIVSACWYRTGRCVSGMCKHWIIAHSRLSWSFQLFFGTYAIAWMICIPPPWSRRGIAIHMSVCLTVLSVVTHFFKI